MHKYQREKVKRMKKLGALGIGYRQQKKMVKVYGIEAIDLFIEKTNEAKNAPAYKNIVERFRRLSRVLKLAIERSITK